VIPDYDPDAVSVTWETGYRDYYQIGDGFRLELIITNENEIPVSFPGLYLRGLNFGFAPPNAIHLISPNGEDVLLPYQTLEGLTGYADPITVAAQGGYYFDFVIPSRFKLWRPGAYTLWAELQDEFGTLHHSNELTFDVVDTEPSINPDLIDFTIGFEENHYTDAPNRIEITITNNASQPIALVDSGGYPPFLPFYDIIVKDSSNRWLPNMPSGLSIAEICEFLDDEQRWLQIEPGSSYQQVVKFPNFVQLWEKIPGEYSVQLSYRMVPYDLCTGEAKHWGDEVFIGHFESNVTQFTLE